MKKGIKSLAMWLIIGIIAIVLITTILENDKLKMTYSELIAAIEAGQVEEIKISSDGRGARVKLEGEKNKKEVNIPSIDSFINYTEDQLKSGAISLEEESESIWITIFSLITPFGLLIIFLIFWFIMMSGNNANGGNKTM
ncbi:MAG: hypothetical protein HFJ48_02490, partial [Clostridia bacterium]|nr:hypothetical protein [Clostridia bacterium]